MSKKLKEWAIEYYTQTFHHKLTYAFHTDASFTSWEALRVGLEALNAMPRGDTTKPIEAISFHCLGSKDILP